jgi:hypothetical protein
LKKHQEKLENRLAQIELAGPDPLYPKSEIQLAFGAGNFEPTVARYRELKATIVPRGLAGPDEERQLWGFCADMIRVHLILGDNATALRHLEEYENGRIAVGLLAMPEWDLQEAILGYYVAEVSTEAAQEKLAFWIAHCISPYISEFVAGHALFKEMVPPKDY